MRAVLHSIHAIHPPPRGFRTFCSNSALPRVPPRANRLNAGAGLRTEFSQTLAGSSSPAPACQGYWLAAPARSFTHALPSLLKPLVPNREEKYRSWPARWEDFSPPWAVRTSSAVSKHKCAPAVAEAAPLSYPSLLQPNAPSPGGVSRSAAWSRALALPGPRAPLLGGKEDG